MTYFISYDITENKIRNKVAKYLEGIAYRMQYSLFMAELDGCELERVKRNLGWITKIAEKPLLLIVPVCKCCEQKIWKVGAAGEEKVSSVVV